jgi:hypothetical protein
MARSSILRTPGHVRQTGRSRTKLVEQRRSIVAGCGFRHVERHKDAAARICVENILNDGIPGLRLVSKTRRYIRQNISHIVARLPVVVVAEAAADEDRLDVILQREPIGELAVHERTRRQNFSELY